MRLIVFLNKIFRRPGVEGRESATADGPLIQPSSKQAEAYCEWEYRWGKDLIAEYLEPSGDLAGKKVLDIGCGLGGKTAAYGEGGAAEILGVDLSLDNIVAGERFIRREPRDFRWGLFLGDAARLPLPAGIPVPAGGCVHLPAWGFLRGDKKPCKGGPTAKVTTFRTHTARSYQRVVSVFMRRRKECGFLAALY